MLKYKTVTLLENISSDNCKVLCQFVKDETGKHVDFVSNFNTVNVYTCGTEEDRKFLQKYIFNDSRLLRRIARGNLQTKDLKKHLEQDTYVYKGNVTAMNEDISRFYNVPYYPSPVYICPEYA